jgi:hypothetical protein
MKNFIRLLFIFNILVAFQGVAYATEVKDVLTDESNPQGRQKSASSVDSSVTGDDSNKPATVQKSRFSFKCPQFDFRSWLQVPSFLKRGVAKVGEQGVDENASQNIVGRNKGKISVVVAVFSVGAGIYFYKPEWVATGLQILQGLAVNGTALVN